MLTQLRSLSFAVDGRYASDGELEFMNRYLQSFDLRLSTYQKLQAAEVEIINEVESTLKSLDPHLLMRGTEDFQTKWRSDTVRVFRLSLLTMLLDDPDRYQERFLLWFQTLMRAFKTQRSCEVTYRVLLETVKKHLTGEEASLICPILELNRTMLGT
ncbi:MAG: phycobilisome protein [Cyanobacteriota bacterium]|nr:phycobilisome protein [Cyanobacteriota bacterium]